MANEMRENGRINIPSGTCKEPPRPAEDAANYKEWKFINDLYMERLETQFRETNNPLYVWAAWQRTVYHRLALPAWAAHAITGWSLNVMNLAINPPTERIAEHAGAAFGFQTDGNGQNAFRQFKMQYENERLLRDYLRLVWSGRSMTGAIQEIEENGTSEPVEFGLTRSTIKRRLEDVVRALGVDLKEVRPGSDLCPLVLIQMGQHELATRLIVESEKSEPSQILLDL